MPYLFALAVVLVLFLPGQLAAGEPDADTWRVLTHRIIWTQAAKSLQNRLCTEQGISSTRFTRRELVLMHIFDDATIYTSRSAARKAQKTWNSLGIDSHIEKESDGFHIDLGRYFIPEFAADHEKKLRRLGRAYRYIRTTKLVPVHRLVLPAMVKKQADKLWRHLSDMGLAAPLEMPETEFRRLYPDYRDDPAPCTKDANRSNK
ncbi:MAG: hypothetical protein D6703_02610 [Zetaproteobacteria bacterium]|nr:MAG: hypothetical protein D6703_02610 [Zetaproteobacteria bacterium]